MGCLMYFARQRRRARMGCYESHGNSGSLQHKCAPDHVGGFLDGEAKSFFDAIAFLCISLVWLFWVFFFCKTMIGYCRFRLLKSLIGRVLDRILDLSGLLVAMVPLQWLNTESSVFRARQSLREDSIGVLI